MESKLMLRNFKLILLILIGQCVCDVNVHLTQESNGKSEIDIDTNNRGCSPQHEVAMGGFSKAKVFANRGEKAAAKERIKNTWGIKPEQNYTMERYREQIVNGANYLYEIKTHDDERFKVLVDATGCGKAKRMEVDECLTPEF